MMNEWTLGILPYILGIAIAAGIVILRPLGQRLAPVYVGTRGSFALALTWMLGALGVWGAFVVSGRSFVLAIVLVLAGPLAAGIALLAYIDGRRASRSEVRGSRLEP